MFLSNLPLVLALAQSAALGLASPAVASPLAARSQLCANLPHTAAGAIPHRRKLDLDTADPNWNNPISNHLAPRASGVVWCVENSPIYIILDIDPLPAGDTLIPAIQGTLENATTTLLHHVEQKGDGNVTAWIFKWPPSPNLSTKNMVLVGRTVSTQEHQLTWSVLDAAFMAFWDYMQFRGYGLGSFRIYFGEVEVGLGYLRQGHA